MDGSFLSSWLNGDARALSFLGAGVRSAEERKRHVQEASKRTISPALAKALRAQNARYARSDARDANLAALERGRAAAVITGQQAGLYLGPLFTFYKAASTIVLARALFEETGIPCVPIFWLQSEDHDFQEIREAMLPGGVTLALPGDDERMSVKHRVLGAAIAVENDRLEAALAEWPEARAFLELVREHYRAERSCADAFAGLLAACFADEGLVIVDPRDPEIATLTAPVLKRSIAECDAIAEVLSGRGRALKEEGFAEQVHVRSASPLAFFHTGPTDGTGPRYRIERASREAKAWTLVGGTQTVEERAVSDAAPMCLSSSALLRPIVQDSLFPTAAYVAGPSEAVYHAQLGPLYRYFELTQPMVALRARFCVVDATMRSLLERTGLKTAELAQPAADLLKRIAQSEHPSRDVLAPQLLGELERGLDALSERATTLDPNLRDPIAKTRDTVTRAVDRLLDRYERARANKDSVAKDRIARLQAMLYPNGAPQERIFGLPYFAARFGLLPFKQLVLDGMSPYDPALRELHP